MSITTDLAYLQSQLNDPSAPRGDDGETVSLQKILAVMRAIQAAGPGGGGGGGGVVTQGTNPWTVGGTVSIAGTVPVSAASLPLPANASQETGGNLATLAGAVTGTKFQDNLAQVGGSAIALGQGLMAASLPVVIASNQTGVPVTGTFWQATQPVSGTFWQATQPVSGTITANAGTGTFNIQANASVNNAQVAGTAVSVNNGTTDAGTTRVTLSSDSTGQVKLATGANTIGSLTANQSVNNAQVSGTAVSVSNGTTDAGTTRVTLSSDSTGQVKLATGANTIGALTANQSVNNAQVSGTTVSVSNGTTDAGTTRVTLSSDSTGQVKLATGANTIGALTANQSVNQAQFAGVTVTQPSIDVSFGSVATHTSKNAAGNFLAFSASNANAAVRYFQIHNLAAVPTGGETPIYSILLPAGSALQPTVFEFGAEFFGPAGKAFSTGISWAMSTAQATYTAATAGDHNVHVHYN